MNRRLRPADYLRLLSGPLDAYGTGVLPSVPMSTPSPDEPVLRCPECTTHRDGIARIGNRKTKCRTCNRFAQAVRRLVARRLTDAHPDEAQRLRLIAEAEVYDQITQGQS